MRKDRYLSVFLVFYLILNNWSFAGKSDTAKYWNIKLNYHNGSILQTNDFVRGINQKFSPINHYQAFALQIGKQTTGKNYWKQLYGYPTWGVGIYVADFFNPEEMGYPIAIYGSFAAPFKRWNKFSFNYNLKLGLTFNWRKFDPFTNNYNIAIGSGETVYIFTGIDFSYQINKRINIAIGGGFTHFSNGDLKKPNLGINASSLLATTTYSINKNSPEFRKSEKKVLNKQNIINVSFYAGLKNVLLDNNVTIDIKLKYQGAYFPEYGISGVYNKTISYMSRIGLGATVSYDGSINAQIAIENGEIETLDQPFFDKIQMSIYPSYELVANKISLVLQPGFYIFRKKITNQTPVFYQRVGIKFHFCKNFFFAVNLRAYKFYISDYIEWSIGYKINS